MRFEESPIFFVCWMFFFIELNRPHRYVFMLAFLFFLNNSRAHSRGIFINSPNSCARCICCAACVFMNNVVQQRAITIVSISCVFCDLAFGTTWLWRRCTSPPRFTFPLQQKLMFYETRMWYMLYLVDFFSDSLLIFSAVHENHAFGEADPIRNVL